MKRSKAFPFTKNPAKKIILGDVYIYKVPILGTFPSLGSLFLAGGQTVQQMTNTMIMLYIVINSKYSQKHSNVGRAKKPINFVLNIFSPQNRQISSSDSHLSRVFARRLRPPVKKETSERLCTKGGNSSFSLFLASSLALPEYCERGKKVEKALLITDIASRVKYN